LSRRKPEPTVIEQNGGLTLNKLSKSSASLAADCLFAWYLKYVLKIKFPMDYTLFRGIVGHDGLEQNNITKIETGDYLSYDDIQQYTAEAWEQQLSFSLEDEGGINWESDGERINQGREKDALIDQVGDYRRKRADFWTPSASEERFELRFKNVDWYLEGYIDVIAQLEGQDNHNLVVDYKFSGSKLTKPAKEDLLNMQHPAIEPALYQVGARSRGIEPGGFQYERLVHNKKGLSYDPFPFAVPSSAEKGALRWLKSVSDMIQALLDALNGTPSVSNHGGFIPRISTYPGERWKCRRCEYADICTKELSKL